MTQNRSAGSPKDSVTGSEYPVGAFDHLMLADDRPEYPMTFYVRLLLSGPFDEERFGAATAAAVVRHPLFQSRLSGDCTEPSRRLKWFGYDTPQMPEMTVLKGSSRDAELRATSRGIDLTREIGVRFVVKREYGHTELIVQVHHACADAAGTFRFLEDVLVYYHTGGTRNQDPAGLLRPIDREMLRDRERCQSGWLVRGTRLVHGVGRVRTFFAGEPAALAVPCPSLPAIARLEGGDKPLGLNSVSSTLPRAEVRMLCQLARSVGATVNDVLLRDLFVALAEWNRQFDSGCNERGIRLAMPINLRRAVHASLPAANLVSMCFLQRDVPSDCDLAALLSSITHETRTIKRHDLGRTLLTLLSLSGMRSGGVSRMVNSQRCHTTSVLSNLRHPFADVKLPRDGSGRLQSGELTVEAAGLIPQIRAGVPVAFGVVCYAGELRIELHYDSGKFAMSQARDLLNRYTDRLERTLYPVAPPQSSQERSKRMPYLQQTS